MFVFVKNWHIHEDILRQNWLIHLYADRNVYLVNLVSTGFYFTFAHIYYIVCLSVSSQLNDGLIEIQGYLPLKISFKPHRKPFNAFGSINQISTWLNVHYFGGGACMCVCAAGEWIVENAGKPLGCAIQILYIHMGKSEDPIAVPISYHKLYIEWHLYTTNAFHKIVHCDILVWCGHQCIIHIIWYLLNASLVNV